MLQQAADKMDESLDKIYKYIFGHIMTQMTAAASIKKHGQAAVDGLLQEFCQLDSKNVFEPLDASTLTASQKRESLRAVNLIKEKRSGKLKGRTCADGRSQRSKTCSPLMTYPSNLTNEKTKFFTALLQNYFTFPKELVPTLNWLLLSSAPGSRAARSRIGKS